MKHADRKLVAEAQDLIWSILGKMQTQYEIASSGSKQDVMSEFSRLSSIKPEMLIRKTEKMRHFDPLPEEVIAVKAWAGVVDGLSSDWAFIVSQLLLLYRALRLQENKATKRKYTHKDCARQIGISDALYLEQYDRVLELLLVHYKHLKSQYVVPRVEDKARYGVEC
jgi:hypothetical protein